MEEVAPLPAVHHALRALVMALMASLVSPASAQTRPAYADAEIGRCITRAAGGKNWIEKTLWGLRDQEGGWIGAEIANTNGSHDLGPLQINSWWVPRIAAVLRRPQLDVRKWLKSDACFNADVARWIFLSALRSTGDYWTAIGVYHSPTAWRARRYALSVAGHLTRRFGPEIFGARGRRLDSSTSNDAAGSPDSDMREARTFGFGVTIGSPPPEYHGVSGLVAPSRRR